MFLNAASQFSGGSSGILGRQSGHAIEFPGRGGTVIGGPSIHRAAGADGDRGIGNAGEEQAHGGKQHGTVDPLHIVHLKPFLGVEAARMGLGVMAPPGHTAVQSIGVQRVSN